MKTCYNCFHESEDSASRCGYCGYSLNNDQDEKFLQALPPGSVLNGRYITGRVLGQGGFGITYIAQDYNTRELAAIKEYFPSALATRTGSRSVMAYSSFNKDSFSFGKEQFLKEAKTLSQFSNHPNIVKIYKFFEENGTAYFVMEYLKGDSLKGYVRKKGGRLSWQDTLNILLPVMKALEDVHRKGIIHRDISPDNIAMADDGKVKLLDFGAARYSMGERSQSLSVVLKHGFAPVEQYYSHGRQGAWTDVYAMAATFYNVLTGRMVPSSIDRILDDCLILPSTLGISIPAYAEAALAKALAVRREDRFQTMEEFEAALSPRIVDPPPPPPPPPPKKVISGKMIGLIAAALLLLVCVYFFFGRKHTSDDVAAETEMVDRSGAGTENRNGEETETPAAAEAETETDTISGSGTDNRLSDDSVTLTDSWEQIIAAGRDGTYREKYRIGDTKELDLGQEGIITMKLAALDEDELADGSGKAPMTWIAEQSLDTQHYMNSVDTNAGGWEHSEMRAWLREYLQPLLPPEIQEGVSEVLKYSNSYEQKKTVASKDTLWIPSARELNETGGSFAVNESEGVIYDCIFSDDASRVRWSKDNNAKAWWLRTDGSDGECFHGVTFEGWIYSAGKASEDNGVVLGFCLGRPAESSSSLVSNKEKPDSSPGKTWQTNILMEDPVVDVFDYDGAKVSKAFSGPVTREEVGTVTFLDTLSGQPSDSWDVSAKKDRSVMAWAEKKGDYYDLFIAGEGGVLAPENCGSMFYAYINLKVLNFGKAFHTEQTVDMEYMFAGCHSLTDLDLSGFDTSKVTDMGSMFSLCSDLRTLDVLGFDTSNVTDLSFMFNDCDKLKSIDLKNFNTSKVTTMAYMFYGCFSLTNLDLSGFDTSKVTDMGSMFTLCKELTALDVSGFDTSNVNDMDFMFSYCEKLKSIDLKNFNTSKAETMAYMFKNCSGLQAVDLSSFDLSNVRNMQHMFENCESLEDLNLEGWDTTSIKDINKEGMFDGTKWSDDPPF